MQWMTQIWESQREQLVTLATRWVDQVASVCTREEQAAAKFQHRPGRVSRKEAVAAQAARGHEARALVAGKASPQLPSSPPCSALCTRTTAVLLAGWSVRC